MLADVLDVAKRAGALLDDPANSIYTVAYLMPFIDQCYDTLDVDLELAGMQYVQSDVTVTVAAGTSDLSPLMCDGQPLATMKYPKRIWWKLSGQDASTYLPSAFTNFLDPTLTPQYSQGAYQWTFADGALQITPSGVDVDLLIYFDEMSTNVVDPSTNVVRGTAHILAARVAAEAAATRKGMEVRAQALDKKADKWWNAFRGVLSKNNQSKQIQALPMHPRRRFGVSPSGYAT